MTTSLIINTCALGALSTLNSSKTAVHAKRAHALRNWLLPSYVTDTFIDEVIVVGEWESGPGYTYVPVSSAWFDCRDALNQRQIGFEESRGDTLIFQHDDHWWPDFPLMTFADVTIPQRWTRLRSSIPERLNNGEEDDYISGHCAIYKRTVLEVCPWSAVPRVHTWDIEHTRQIREAGFTIKRSDARAWDIEEGSTPWL